MPKRVRALGAIWPKPLFLSETAPGSAGNAQAGLYPSVEGSSRLLELKFTTGDPKGPPVLSCNDFERVLKYAQLIANNKQVERSIPHKANRTQTRQLTSKSGKDMKYIFTECSLIGAFALLAKWRCMLKIFNQELERGGTQMRRFGGSMLFAAVLTGSVAATLADAAPPAGVPTEDGMRAFALQWFAQIQAGKIDRTQYTAAYGAQLTDAAVQAMSHHLNEYGASPVRAEIMQKRSVDNQTLYQVKLVFPRGDANSLLFGFDAEGKITGVAIMSMAGD